MTRSPFASCARNPPNVSRWLSSHVWPAFTTLRSANTSTASATTQRWTRWLSSRRLCACRLTTSVERGRNDGPSRKEKQEMDSRRSEDSQGHQAERPHGQGKHAPVAGADLYSHQGGYARRAGRKEEARPNELGISSDAARPDRNTEYHECAIGESHRMHAQRHLRRSRGRARQSHLHSGLDALRVPLGGSVFPRQPAKRAQAAAAHTRGELPGAEDRARGRQARAESVRGGDQAGCL